MKWKIMNLKIRVVLKDSTCYQFNDIIKLEDFDIDNILINKKLHENILIYDIPYKTFIDPKPLHIRFDKIDRFIRIYDGARCLALFGSEKYNFTHNRTRCLISLKNSITYIFSHYFAKIKVDSYIFLPKERILNLHNSIAHIKAVLNKDKNH